ncbi:ABC-2 type transport system permease protein [Caloramator quimbayensis]|uniref:ABC-2 type transport system permease protein n=1 Tax=Caloramator quimbayensis TaxID=1147123 RepID=A0A1T4YGJ2_9CLOT|nr:ABC transporter permease [Caloramator quimbayensis]SKB00411.1 ABC-2 type transport system permease protein [Caloramator quimbayensis]
MLAVFRRELKSYFTTPIGYVFMGVFLLISGIFFSLMNLLQNDGNYVNVLNTIVFIFLFLVPILTMRTLSEEKKNKTEQLLLTSPISIWDIVFGKFLASATLFFITLVITLIYPLIIKFNGYIAPSEVLCTYIGFFLIGCSFIAVGTFISSLTENQISSAIGTFGALLILWIMEWITQNVQSGIKSGLIFALILTALIVIIINSTVKNPYFSGVAGIIGLLIVFTVYFTKKSFFEGFIANFLNWMSVLTRFDSFSGGVFDVSSVVYYLSFIFVFLLLTVKSIDKKRWS